MNHIPKKLFIGLLKFTAIYTLSVKNRSECRIPVADSGVSGEILRFGRKQTAIQRKKRVPHVHGRLREVCFLSFVSNNFLRF